MAFVDGIAGEIVFHIASVNVVLARWCMQHIVHVKAFICHDYATMGMHSLS